MAKLDKSQVKLFHRSLAFEIGMSRSAFSSRFVQLLGEPPMTYLTRWRLNRTAFWLRTSKAKIGAIADLVGYDSEASLSKAFKRCFGLSPGAYRRHSVVANNGSPIPARNEDSFDDVRRDHVPALG